MKIICLICGTKFKPRTKFHRFCSRHCFKINYNRILRERNMGKYPDFLCPNCGEVTKLSFNPKKDTIKWSNFICSCGYKNNLNY